MKMEEQSKAEDSLGLPLFLDPKLQKVDNGATKSARVRICLRTKELLAARRKNPEKYNQWRNRIDKFCKKKVWGPTPKVLETGNEGTLPPLAVNAAPVLPSRSLWHYYYYGGKTRVEREKERKVEVERLRQERKEVEKKLEEERKEKIEARRRSHKKRVTSFARKGLKRREDRRKSRAVAEAARRAKLDRDIYGEDMIFDDEFYENSDQDELDELNATEVRQEQNTSNEAALSTKKAVGKDLPRPSSRGGVSASVEKKSAAKAPGPSPDALPENRSTGPPRKPLPPKPSSPEKHIERPLLKPDTETGKSNAEQKPMSPSKAAQRPAPPRKPQKPSSPAKSPIITKMPKPGVNSTTEPNKSIITQKKSSISETETAADQKKNVTPMPNAESTVTKKVAKVSEKALPPGPIGGAKKKPLPPPPKR